MTDSSTSMINNAFENCTINFPTQSETRHGNTIHLLNSDMNLSYSCFALCGPTKNQCSDSCIWTVLNKIIVENLNFSFNNGFNGGNSVAIKNSQSGTYYKYSSVAHGQGDYSFFEFIIANFPVFQCNFVNASNLKGIISSDVTNQNSVVTECIFIDADKGIIGNGVVTFSKSMLNIPMQVDRKIIVEPNILPRFFEYLHNQCVAIPSFNFVDIYQYSFAKVIEYLIIVTI